MTEAPPSGAVGVISVRDTKKLYRGYDRIRIRLPWFRVGEDHPLVMIPTDGRPYRSCRRLFETQTKTGWGFQALLKQSDWWSGRITAPPPGYPRFMISFNPSRWHYGINHPPASATELDSTIASLHEELSAAGIETDLGGSAVSHLEVASDILLPAGISTTLGGMAKWKAPPRMTLIHRYPSGLTWANKSVEIAVYDKRAECAARGVQQADLPAPGTLRLETRLKRPATVRYHVGVDRLEGLSHAWPSCEASHLRFLGQLLAGGHG